MPKAARSIIAVDGTGNPFESATSGSPAVNGDLLVQTSTMTNPIFLGNLVASGTSPAYGYIVLNGASPANDGGWTGLAGGGDTNLYADAGSTGNIFLRTSNNTTGKTTRLAVNASGNIGINTTTASSLFDVKLATDVHIEMRLASSAAQLFTTNDLVNAYNTFQIDGNPVTLNVNSGGNVGISVGSPGALLSLGSAITTIKCATYDDGVSTHFYGIGVNAGQLTFGAAIAVNGTAQMSLNNSGQVGIGMTQSNPLDVHGIIRGDNEIISSAAAASGANIRTIGGNYGAFFRNDGTYIYLLITASGSQYGTWNTLRPFYVLLTTGTVGMNNGLIVVSGTTTDTLTLSAGTTLITTTAALTNNAAAQTATLTNSPTAGNPTKWIPINDNGTTRNIPAW